MALTIERLETRVVHVNRRGDWVFCLIHTSDGITGLGEASHGLNDALVVSALEQYGRRLVGKDPRRIEAIWASLTSRHGGRIEHTALSAIEQALWDILGQHLGVPIRVLLGGEVRDRVRLYANVNRHVVDRSPGGFAAAAARPTGAPGASRGSLPPVAPRPADGRPSRNERVIPDNLHTHTPQGPRLERGLLGRHGGRPIRIPERDPEAAMLAAPHRASVARDAPRGDPPPAGGPGGPAGGRAPALGALERPSRGRAVAHGQPGPP